MADRETRSGTAPLSGRLRQLWPLFALLSAVFLSAAVVVAVSAPGAAPRVVARAEGTQLTLQGTGSRLRLYGALAPGAREVDARCRLMTAGAARVVGSFGSPLELDGTSLLRLGAVDAGWSEGDVVRCQAVTELAATAGGGRLARLGLAGLCGFVGLGTGLLAAAGHRAARRAGPGVRAARAGSAGAP